MPFACLRASVVLTMLFPSVALAGGGTGGGGGGTSVGDSGGFATGTDSGVVVTGTGGTGGATGTGGMGGATDTDATGGATDTGGSDSGTTGGSSSSGEFCGECTPLDEPVQIISPVDGAVVGRTFEVRVTAPYTCSCDTMCCDAFDPSTIGLRIDGMSYETCSSDECNTTDHTFMVVDLAPGTYELDALAPVDFSVEFSARIQITVEGELATGDTTGSGDGNVSAGMTAGVSTTSSGSSSSGPAASDGNGGGGCGCRSGSSPVGPPGALLGMLVLGSLRRRR